MLDAAPASSPPAIASLLKPAVYQKVVQDKSIQSYASLDRVESSQSDPPLKKYSFYAAMLTRTGLTRTRKVLTDYELYSKLIPYIDEAKYYPETHRLDLKGGIWKFKLTSVLRFEEIGDRWIRFRIVGGHFTGLVGDIFFESYEDKGTLVYMRGEQEGYHWPPAFIIEKGAEIVFEFTARRMRSYIESEPGTTHDERQVPQPRSHL